MPSLDLQEALDLIEKGQADEAISLLTTWSRRMPTYAAVHVALARAYEAAEQWDAAQAAWKDAHFLMPNSPPIVEGLARTRRRVAQTVPAGEDPLMMDLDLQAELEATLEALFNPFTLPHQAGAALEPPPLPPAAKEEEEEKDEEDTLAQVEAALAAAADSALSEEDVYVEDGAFAEPEADEDEATAMMDVMVGVEEADEDEAPSVLDGWEEFEIDAEDNASPKTPDIDDLERLISELESARIVPQPELDDVPPPDLNDDIDDMVSETLARIFASQEQYQEAARVYEQLALQHPEEADRFNQLAADMRTLDTGSEK